MDPICINSQSITELSCIKGYVLPQGDDCPSMAEQQGLQLFFPEWKIWEGFRKEGTFFLCLAFMPIMPMSTGPICLTSSFNKKLHCVVCC